jgi:hypothetical protein
VAKSLLAGILDEDDGDDPILSVVNIVDVFLVVIAVLLIRNPGRPGMEMLVRQGNELKRYRSSGRIGEGEGQKTGTAYRMKDGTMVYVPESADAP